MIETVQPYNGRVLRRCLQLWIPNSYAPQGKVNITETYCLSLPKIGMEETCCGLAVNVADHHVQTIAEPVTADNPILVAWDIRARRATTNVPDRDASIAHGDVVLHHDVGATGQVGGIGKAEPSDVFLVKRKFSICKLN